MKIVPASFVMLRPESVRTGIDQLRLIEEAARVSHRSEEAQTEASWRRFIQAVVLQHGDWSVVEHAIARVFFRVDRGVTHELVRHRLFSFTQESTRFVNYRKRDMEFVMPEGLVPMSTAWDIWVAACEAAEKAYTELLDLGKPPQLARAVLPNSLASTILVTGNLRNWRHFLIMRTTKETHPDMRRVTDPLLEEFKARIPLLFDDITAGEKQSIAMAKAR